MAKIAVNFYNQKIVPPPPPPRLTPILRRDQIFLLSKGDPENYYSRYAPDGSFGQVGGRGQNFFIDKLGAAEIRFIRSLPANNRLWNWAASPKGTVYTNRDDVAGTVRWPMTLMTSTYSDIQQVRIVEKGVFQILSAGMAPSEVWRVDAIPWQASGDYSAYTPDKHPEMWVWAWTDFLDGTYGVSHTYPDGSAYTFRVPLFDPRTFPFVSSDARAIGGLYIDANCFGE